ncbi:hypothetical protein Dimus_005959, partial [Dionaea muscipula]
GLKQSAASDAKVTGGRGTAHGRRRRWSDRSRTNCGGELVDRRITHDKGTGDFEIDDSMHPFRFRVE